MSWSDAGGRCDLTTALEGTELSNSAVEADVALATLGTTQLNSKRWAALDLLANSSGGDYDVITKTRNEDSHRPHR
jgi:hypothetical protein